MIKSLSKASSARIGQSLPETKTSVKQYLEFVIQIGWKLAASTMGVRYEIGSHGVINTV